ncbi:uroporphyrinogen decarboxylase family protein [Staphylococcus aureus]
MVHNKNNTILKMIKVKETTHTPVWFMRQAGQSTNLEYRKLKEKIFTIRYYTSAGVVRLCNTFTS